MKRKKPNAAKTAAPTMGPPIMAAFLPAESWEYPCPSAAAATVPALALALVELEAEGEEPSEMEKSEAVWRVEVTVVVDGELVMVVVDVVSCDEVVRTWTVEVVPAGEFAPAPRAAASFA